MPVNERGKGSTIRKRQLRGSQRTHEETLEVFVLGPELSSFGAQVG